MDVCRLLRADPDTRELPILMLTARGATEDRVQGLEVGADDYLAKPFEIAELEARIRVQLRRAHDRTSPVISCGDLSLDTNLRQFRLGERLLLLTPREHAVLEQLLLKSGQTVSKAKLSESVFGFDDDADPTAIEIYVHRVRKKLEGGRVRIVTLRGLGYLLRHEE
jgi:two-component system response regulator TctD